MAGPKLICNPLNPPSWIQRLTTPFASLFGKLFGKLWCPECKHWKPTSLNGWRRCDDCATLAAMNSIIRDSHRQLELSVRLAVEEINSMYRLRQMELQRLQWQQQYQEELIKLLYPGVSQPDRQH